MASSNYTEISKILNSEPTTKEDFEKYKASKLAEYEITNVRAEKAVQHIQGNFDFKHLSEIHKFLFNELYPFAGQIRDYEFRKNIDYAQGSLFAKPDEIENIIQECSQEIIDNNYYRHLDQEQFINKFTEFYAKLNYAHPFEEGNGRTLKIMMAQFAEKAGYIIVYPNSSKEWNKASYEANPRSFRMFEGYPHPISREANLKPLQDIFRQAIKRENNVINQIEGLKEELSREKIKVNYPNIPDKTADEIAKLASMVLDTHKNANQEEIIHKLKAIVSKLDILEEEPNLMPVMPQLEQAPKVEAVELNKSSEKERGR